MPTTTGRNLLLALVAGIALAVYYFRVTSGTGPLELSTARGLVERHLPVAREHVEVVIPDGELAQAPADTLSGLNPIACPELGSSLGTLPGRYGMGERTYGSAAFACLFTASSASGVQLHFSVHVHRSADPSVRSHNDGHTVSLQRATGTRALMAQFERATDSQGPQKQAALWKTLAADGIYVPADKSQKSPLQKALEAHSRRISSE